MKVAVCVITCKRPEGLKRLLNGLNKLSFNKCFNTQLEIIIVDNDVDGSARSVCESFELQLKWSIKYCIEPNRGIPYARNKSLACVEDDADFIAFIDDDEVPDSNWLDELLYNQKIYDADVVSGPVMPYFSEAVPEWILKGKFFERPYYPTGSVLNKAATNNTLVCSKVFKNMNSFFDERFALNGGDDLHFFMRVHRAGYKIVRSNEALVYEWIPKSRANAKWILQRAYRLGNTYSLCEVEFEPSITVRLKRIVKVAGRIGQGLLLMPLSLFIGRHIFIQSLKYIYTSAGILTGMTGIVYEEYRTIHRV